MKEYKFIIEGLDCPNCSAKLERAIANSKLFNDVIKGWNDLNPYFELCKKCTYRNRFRKEK